MPELLLARNTKMLNVHECQCGVVQVLQPPHGIVLVAAKSYYFGVGGGIKTFTKAVKQDGIFDVAPVYKTNDDVTSAVMSALPEDAREPSTTPGEEEQEGQAEGGAGGAAATAGGNVREVLELSFPLSIQPYFL